MSGSSKHQLRVLVVDDNLAELRLITEAFKANHPPAEVLTATNGIGALRELQRADCSRPDLVLLDINMPGLSGHEVLEHIKSDSKLRTIIVLMFSSSAAEADITRAYSSHANGYLSKPADLDEYFALARHVTEFWTRIAVLPRRAL